MFQFSGLGISLTKPHGEKMNVLLRGTSLRPSVLIDAPADAAADDADAEGDAEAAADAAAEGAAEAAVEAAADGALDVVEVPHAATSRPTIARPDSHVAGFPWRPRRGFGAEYRSPLARRRMLKEFLLLWRP